MQLLGSANEQCFLCVGVVVFCSDCYHFVIYIKLLLLLFNVDFFLLVPGWCCA